MADLDEDDDSGVYGAILDLSMGAVGRLESEWVGGPHAYNIAHAKENLAASRAALDKVAGLLDVEAKRSREVTSNEHGDLNG